MKLFVRGNEKVGDNALVFNLPDVKTCPGRTPFCEAYCYGHWGGNRWPSTRLKHEANYSASQRPDFPALAVAELQAAGRRRLPHLCRVHSDGDFYSAEYIRKWVDIATAAPSWTFWAYTKSWRKPDLLPELERLAALPNFKVWVSVDFMTGLPPDFPWARGVAWMQAIGENLDWMKEIGRESPWSNSALLVLPVKDEDRQPVKRIGLAMVCPHYSGVPEDKVPTCEECRFCFTAPPVR